MSTPFKRMKWVARIVATLLFLAIAGFMLAHGLPSLGELTVREQVMFVGLFVMLAGTLVGWKSERLGGVLLLGGFLFFCVVDNLGKTAFRGRVWVAFAPFAVAGILYLAAAFLEKRASHA